MKDGYEIDGQEAGIENNSFRENDIQDGCPWLSGREGGQGALRALQGGGQQPLLSSGLQLHLLS